MGDVEDGRQDLYEWIDENLLATAADVNEQNQGGATIDVSQAPRWNDESATVSSSDLFEAKERMKEQWASEQERRSAALQEMLDKVPPQMRRDPLVGMLVTIISNGLVCPPVWMEKWKAAYERALKRAAVTS